MTISRPLMKFPFKCWLLLGLIFCPAISERAAEFEVEGSAINDLYSGKYFQGSYTNYFIVSVRGIEWGITTWSLGSSPGWNVTKILIV
jgi:hypothetical protein